LRGLLKKYRHIWVVSYLLIYMPWFGYLQSRRVGQYHIMHSFLDNYIPFDEYFIVFYLMWFLFIFAAFVYFFFTDVQGFYRLTGFLFLGMTVSLIIYTIYPTGQNLRPEVFSDDNVFVTIVQIMYQIDPPINVMPSIHVYNTLGACIAVAHSDTLRANHRWAQIVTYILGTLIILSTLFLKQHSIVDVAAAFLMAGAAFLLFYHPFLKKFDQAPNQPAGRLS